MKKYKYIIIILNAVLIILCSYILYEDYQRVGYFQWVDQNSIADDEELYLNVISVTTIGLSLISIMTQINDSRIFERQPRNQLLIVSLNVINGLYGIFVVFVGAFFSIALLANLGNNAISDLEDIIFLILAFLIFGAFIALGVSILRQIYLQTEGNIQRRIDIEDILDIEIGGRLN